MTGSAIVVGAGVTGLATAWVLRQSGVQTRVFEAAPRPGGVLHSQWIDGICVEGGPQALRGAGGATAEIIDGLGLRERLRASSKAASKRYLLYKGKLWAVPGGPGEILGGGPLSAGAILRALAEPLMRSAPDDHETLHEFVSRRLGPGIADPLVEAFVGGIYAGDSRQLEASSAFPKLTGLEQDFGSIILGGMRKKRVARPEWLPKGSFTFDRGADVLVRAMADALGEDLALGCAVTSIKAHGSGFVVEADGESYEADRVVIATEPRGAARIESPYKEAYDGIPASPVATVHLAWPKGSGPPSEGFGWLTPSSERADVLGVIWVSSVFPHLAPDHDMVRVMLGGSRDPALALRDEQSLVEHALEVVRSAQGPADTPSFTHVGTHKVGIPQYVRGHGARQKALREVPGLHAVGWGVTGVGVTQCLETASTMAHEIAASLGG